jgi:hypothetical protein
MLAQMSMEKDPMGRREWTQEEADQLKALWLISSAHQISRRLRRSRNSIISKANRLGLEKGHDDTWSAKDTAALKRLWQQPERGVAEIAAVLGRSFPSCVNKASRLGLGCRHRKYRKKPN